MRPLAIKAPIAEEPSWRGRIPAALKLEALAAA
jgi:hypothetical protein